MSDSQIRYLKYAVIVGLCILCYGDQLDGDFVFDDTVAIVNNKQVSSSNPRPLLDVFKYDYWGSPILSPSSHKSYRPLTSLLFRWEYQWHGPTSSFWMKATNLLLHTIVSCFLVDFGELFIQDNRRTSFVAGVLFAVHPVHTEAVAGIVSRADLLATLTSLLCIYIYFRTFIDKEYSVTPSVLLIVFLAVVGVLFKETAITMLPTCAAFDLLYNTNWICRKWSSWGEVPWMRILLIGTFSILYIVFRGLLGSPQFQLEDNPIAVIEDGTFRAINQVFLHSINAWLLFCPEWLSFDWSMGSVQIIESLSDFRILGVLVHLLVLLVIVLRIFSITSTRRRIQLASMNILTVVPFLPASGIIHVGFVIAERLLYMPSIGTCLLVAMGFRRLTKSVPTCKNLLKVIFIVTVIMFTFKSRLRAAEWKEEKTLYESALRVCPMNAKVHYNIAKMSDRNTAITYYQQAINLHPEYDAALMNLGNLYRDHGDLDKAEYYLRRALSSMKITDKRAAAEMNLGIVMVMRKKYSVALEHYQNALKARPYYPVCYYNMGNAYVELKQYSMAQKNFETALSLDRTLAVAWKNLLTLLYNEDKYEQVIATADKALSILTTDQEHLLFPKANALAKLKRNEEAEEIFLTLIERRPGDAVYYANLGVLYHHWKRFDKAISYYEQALQLNPQLERIRSALQKVKRLHFNQSQ